MPSAAVDVAERVLREAPHVNLCHESLDKRCLRLLTPHEAWTNLVLPLREEGQTLVVATTVETLPSAIDLVEHKLHRQVRYVLTEVRPLEQFIAERYGYEGVDLDDRVELDP